MECGATGSVRHTFLDAGELVDRIQRVHIRLQNTRTASRERESTDNAPMIVRRD